MLRHTALNQRRTFRYARLRSTMNLVSRSLSLKMVQQRQSTAPGLGSIGANFRMKDLNPKLKRFFSFPRFIVQIVSAMITTWVLFGIVSFSFSIGGWKDLFFRERRYLFWGMLLSSSAIFFVWQFAFWPGIMSTDSLKIWRAAQIPGLFLGDHPPLNVILYEYLSYIWNNPAVVPLFQNVITSLLTAYIFFKLYRWGLPLFILIPGYLIIVFSVPIGLYNAVMWKDIPYAVLVVFLGFRLADLSFKKRYRQFWMEYPGVVGLCPSCPGTSRSQA